MALWFWPYGSYFRAIVIINFGTLNFDARTQLGLVLQMPASPTFLTFLVYSVDIYSYPYGSIPVELVGVLLAVRLWFDLCRALDS